MVAISSVVPMLKKFSVFGPRSWLLEMGRAASVSDIEVIYCMALPREILQSAEIEAVTTARVSGDYILSKVSPKYVLPKSKTRSKCHKQILE